MKEFTTALKAAEDLDDEFIEFKIDDQVLKCYRPTAAQFAVASAAVGARRPVQEKLAGIVDFFVEIMDDESRYYVENRLLDRRDPFGLDEIEQIMEWMVEEWSARPTDGPSGSSPSPPRGGRKSTPRTSKSTSGASARTGS